MTHAALPTPVLAVTGLRAEARIASGSGIATLSGGGDATRLALLLQGSLASGARAVISFGIAGGLLPGLQAGDIVIADAVHDGETSWQTDARWCGRLRQALPFARKGTLAGSDIAVPGLDAKAALQRRSGAVAVDMESHIAARLAAQYHVPFVALRVVADPAERSLPQAALVGMSSDGRTDIGAVLRALARRPGDVPALIRTALDARAAFATLRRARQALDSVLGASDGGRGDAGRDVGDVLEFGSDAGLALAKPASDPA